MSVKRQQEETDRVQVNATVDLSRGNNGKHLYYWGLLGFVPNFGLIAGIILGYKGLFKYKDKKLTLIGLGCILFTVFFWIAFKYIDDRGDWFIKNKIELTEMHLNNLVKDIEFYKIKNGNYPEKLEQIEFAGKSIFLRDPFLSSNANDEKQFSYKKVGDGYILFSVGIDRVANTNDDIYPPVTLARN